MLYFLENYYNFYQLTHEEQTILQNYDIFQFYEIYLSSLEEIENFKKVLSKYLVLIKLNNYNIKYSLYQHLKLETLITDYCVKFNFNNVEKSYNIEKLYRDQILSLQDIMDIKNILIHNKIGCVIDGFDFHFKSYDDAKDFLKTINKKICIHKY